MLSVGVLFGLALRAWMRFVSTDPEFSWSGTAFIVGAFAVLGLMAGLCDLGRRRGWEGKLVAARFAGGVLALGCFQGAGVAMFPTVVPAALGVARSDWLRSVRVVLVLGAAIVAGMVVLSMGDLSIQRRLVALVLYAGLCSVEVLLLSRIVAPSLPTGSVRHAPIAIRILLVGLPLVAVFALVIVTVGLPLG